MYGAGRAVIVKRSMGRQQDRTVLPCQQFPQAFDARLIQRGLRLVQQQKPAFLRQGQCQRDFLLLAAGEPVQRPVEEPAVYFKLYQAGLQTGSVKGLLRNHFQQFPERVGDRQVHLRAPSRDPAQRLPGKGLSAPGDAGPACAAAV